MATDNDATDKAPVTRQMADAYNGLTARIQDLQADYLNRNATFKQRYEDYMKSSFHFDSSKTAVGKAVKIIIDAKPGETGQRAKIDALGLDKTQMAIVTACAARYKAEFELKAALEESGSKDWEAHKAVQQLFAQGKSKAIDDVIQTREAEGKALEAQAKAQDAEDAARLQANYDKAVALENQEKAKAKESYADLNIPDPDEKPVASSVADTRISKLVKDVAQLKELQSKTGRPADAQGKTVTAPAAVEAKPEPAPAPAPVAAASAEHALPKLTALVTKGVIVDMRGTSKAHEPARVEVATAVQNTLNELAKDPERKAILWKWMKLDPEKDKSIVLVNEEGQIADRKQAVNATEIYQDIYNLTADGKIGQSTYPQVMASAGNTGVFATQGLARNVAGEKGVGHLGGKMNPFELQNYEGKDAHKIEARKAMDEFKAVLGKVRTQVESQAAEGKYTAAEDKTLKAVFVGVDGKAPLLDTQNLTKEGIKALEKAVHLKADGVIGKDLMRAVAQMSIRTDMGITIDPSEIAAAVATNAAPAKVPSVTVNQLQAKSAKGREQG